MSSVIISGDTSGAITVSAPAVSGTNTLTLQAATATNSVNTLATAVASTSGTAIDFTGLPAWVKRITVMFSGVSGNSGATTFMVQIGAGSFENTGYVSTVSFIAPSTNCASVTTGYGFAGPSGAAAAFSGHAIITTLGSNIWVFSSNVSDSQAQTHFGSGTKTTSGTLDRVRITTVAGTATFDAGSVNILYEG